MSSIYKFEKTFLGEGDVRVNRKRGDVSFITHRHDYYEILLYRDCQGICHLNGQEYAIHDHCLFLLTPNDFHRIEAVAHERSESIVISFSESAVDPQLLAQLSFSPRIWYTPVTRCEQWMEHMNDCYVAADAYSVAKLHHLLNALVCEILEKSEKVKAEDRYTSPVVARAMTMALCDLSANITLSGTARACGLSAAYFSDLFHKQTGKTFKGWLTEVRIEFAKRLLEEDRLSILEIGYECGYNTPSQFIKMFKRAVGVPPSEYRKKS